MRPSLAGHRGFCPTTEVVINLKTFPRNRAGYRRALAGAAGLLMTASAVFADTSSLELSAERQRVVDRYMDILLGDPRNGFAFQKVYRAFKSEKKEFLLVNFFTSAVRLEPENAILHVILAQLYTAFRDYHQAAVKLKQAARMAPNDDYTRYLLASVYLKQKKYAEAALEFRSAAALAGSMEDRVRSLYGLAEVHALMDNWGEATATWEEIAELRPYDVSTFRELAALARRAAQWKLVERWNNRLLELVEDDSEATCFVLIDLAEVAFEQKRYSDAVKHYREARVYLSESHWMTRVVHARIRECFAARGQATELLDIIESQIADHPRDVNARIELAEAARAGDDLPGAARALEAAAEISPLDVQILEEYRAVLMELGDDAGLQSVSERLAALSPENVHYQLQDADYFISRGQREKAKSIWDQVIQHDPGQPARYLAVARAMVRAGTLDWAEDVYRRLTDAAPEVEAYQIELAELYLNRAEELPPTAPADSAAAKAALQQWAERSRDYFERAEKLLSQASQRDKLTLAEMQWAATLLFDHRRLAVAEDVIGQGRKRFPRDMALARMLADVSLRLGAKRPAGSPEQNDLYDRALATSLEALDLAPHPAIRMEMNAELMSLCLKYGAWISEQDKREHRGGAQGIYPLMRKHLEDYYARPDDPLPAWCIADIQQQGPTTRIYYRNVKNAPSAELDIRSGDLDSGIQFFNYALGRDPLFIPGYLGKSVSYTMRDSFEQGVIELRKAAVVDPINKWKYFLAVGDLFANEGQMQEARAFWGRVAGRVFTDASILYQLGTRYFRANEIERALTLIHKAADANPNIYTYHVTLGNIYDQLGDYPRAIAEYRTALKLSSQAMLLSIRQRLSEIQEDWAYQLFDRGDYQPALDQFQEIREFQEVLENHYRQEKDEQAGRRLLGESANILVQMARCHKKLNQPREAASIYDRVLQQYPDAEIYISANRRMSLLHFLDAKRRFGELETDRLETAGTIQPRPFKLALVRHSKLYDIAREHSLAPESIIYAGLAQWVELDPLSGRVLRRQKADKAIRSRDNVEIQVLRQPDGDRLNISVSGNPVTVQGLNQARIRLADLQIGGDQTVFFALKRGAPHIIAVDSRQGTILWEASVSEHTQDLVRDGKYIVSLVSYADRTSLEIREAASGKELLTKKLPGEGLWLTPVIWGDKLFLVDDVAWRLQMLDIPSGNVDYSVSFHGAFPRPPVLHDGVLYLHVRTYRERTIFLYALQPATGQILWKTDMQAMSVHSPPIFRGPDIVYLNPETHQIFMIDRATGVRHAEASYREQMTEQQRNYIQFLRPFGQHLLIVGGRGDIHAFEVQDLP